MNTDPQVESSEYSELTPEQRRELIHDVVKQTPRYWNPYSIQNDTYKSYIQICHSKATVYQDKFGFYPDTGRHSIDCPKVHINCNSSSIPQLINTLIHLQDGLVCEPDVQTRLQPSTFIFKVLCGQEGFQSIRPINGWPPRIVIYPSLLLMYPKLAYQDRTLDIAALQNFLVTLENNLNTIRQWDDTEYRARYYQRLSSNQNDSIELVVGSTVYQGDRSNR